MLMSDRIRINDASAASLMSSRALSADWAKSAIADVASELLTKQRFNIGFVVNDKNKQAHLSAPSLPVAAMRGRMILNSVNAPRAWRKSLASSGGENGEGLEPVTRNVLVEKQYRQGDE
jgi:hypothetical protein